MSEVFLFFQSIAGPSFFNTEQNDMNFDPQV